MSDSSSPNITFMLQYTEANSAYVDYTNRDEAVQMDNDLNLETHRQSVEGMTESQLLIQNDSVSYGALFALEDGVLQVGFDSPVFCDALSKPGNLVLLTKMLQQVSPGMELKLSKGNDDPLADRGKALFGDAFRME